MVVAAKKDIGQNRIIVEEQLKHNRKFFEKYNLK